MPKKLTQPARNALLVFVFSLFSLALSAQNRTVSGKVTNRTNGQPIAGATVQVKGATTTAITNGEGLFTISANSNSTLVVTVVGFQQMEMPVGASGAVDFSMAETASQLNEIVVTGYTAQRRKDIIGSVSVVNVNDLKQTPASNMAVQLQGRSPGVVVSAAGEPGAGAVVRIRGFASAGNNNPLYVIDGVPTDDPNKFNPNDIESMQVLKDASAASIYGARASNGVIIVTTKQGRAGRPNFSYDGYVGTSIVTDKMMPDMLNTTQYVEYLQKTTSSSYSHPVFGANGAFTIPAYYITSGGFKGGVPAGDSRANPALYSLNPLYQISATSMGTNWFDELTKPAMIQSHQISASGGTDKSTYSLGLNYFNQEGSFVNTFYKRYTVRINTSFKPTSFLRLGENFQLMYEERLGGANRGEGDAWASAFRMVPYIPVYDIAGGYGGNGVGESGNGSNPIANLERQRFNKNTFTRFFGNIYAEIPFTSWLNARSSFGVDGGQQFTRNLTLKTYERSENVGTTQLQEDGWSYLNWTWTNTLNFDKTFGDHNVKLLAGTEAIKGSSRGVRSFAQNFDFETPDFVSLNTAVAGSLSDRTVSNFNIGRNTLFSYIGRLDYAYKGKYLLTGTFRRDGSSRFGPNAKYAQFPSVGVAWRASEENFMKSVTWITDLKFRAGWGQMGSQSNVSDINQFFTYQSAAPRTNYDIGGTNTSSAQGYRNDRQGNLDTKWETLETTNFGVDATLFNGKVDFTLDIYQKDTKDLLVDQVRNGLEPQVTKPRINIGTMRNTGFDLGINYRGTTNRSDLSYDIGVTFSRYKNTMTKLNNEGSPRIIGLERLASVVRTDVGQPISSFHGFVLDGFFNSAADISALSQTGAVVGSWRYKDLNGDKVITDADRTYIGNPHPDFQMGFNLGVNYKAFNFNAFFFWNQGNEIFNYTKYYTDMRVFVGGVSTRVLTDSWTPSNMNAKLPVLAPGAANGYTSYTTTTSNNYYVEDGSYFRAKTLQLSYTLPKSLVGKAKLQNVKMYIQAQNLFTFTKYTGADPDIALISRDQFGAGDYYIGVDLGGFPNPKQYLFGINVTF